MQVKIDFAFRKIEHDDITGNFSVALLDDGIVQNFTFEMVTAKDRHTTFQIRKGDNVFIEVSNAMSLESIRSLPPEQYAFLQLVNPIILPALQKLFGEYRKLDSSQAGADFIRHHPTARPVVKGDLTVEIDDDIAIAALRLVCR